jgi:acyl-CoA synthetase (AMP-forming)/AMP-acid ligase II
MIDFLLATFAEVQDREAMVWRNRGYSYGWLLQRVAHWRDELDRTGVEPGTVVALEADFTPNSVALFLALTEARCILVPLTASVESQKPEFKAVAQVEIEIEVASGDEVEIRRLPTRAAHELYDRLRAADRPGLVLFSSGSTGRSKAAVHDLLPILDKFRVRRHTARAITFLLFDHIGGVNTMLYQLSNGGCIVTVQDRNPDRVLDAVARHRVELLPASPTFLNLVLLSDALRQHDLSGLKTVTYGTEPMPESTLARLHAALPHVRLQQTYGLSELGILRSKSRSSDSLWVKIGGEGFETRIVDGVLQIRARSAMLGYLNAPSPFTADGWFDTKDLVEQDGEYIRFLGRVSEVINVGGEKVYPAEVESVIQELEGVAQATVYGERNPIVGNVPCATVVLRGDEEPRAFVRRLKQHLAGRLPKFKIPIRIDVSTEAQHSPRFKKMRTSVSSARPEERLPE